MGKDDIENIAATASPKKRGEHDITEEVIEVVSEKTGYPKEMLDLDLDLEADLGIDTTKQDEILGKICGIYISRFRTRRPCLDFQRWRT